MISGMDDHSRSLSLKCFLVYLTAQSNNCRASLPRLGPGGVWMRPRCCFGAGLERRLSASLWSAKKSSLSHAKTEVGDRSLNKSWTGEGGVSSYCPSSWGLCVLSGVQIAAAAHCDGPQLRPRCLGHTVQRVWGFGSKSFAPRKNSAGYTIPPANRVVSFGD